MSLQNLKNRLSSVKKITVVKTVSSNTDKSLLAKVKSKVKNNIDYLESNPNIKLTDPIPSNGNRKECSPLWFMDDNDTAVWTLMAGRTRVFLEQADITSNSNFQSYECGTRNQFLSTLKEVYTDLQNTSNNDFFVFASIKKPILDANGDYQYEDKIVTRDGVKKTISAIKRSSSYSNERIDDSVKY